MGYESDTISPIPGLTGPARNKEYAAWFRAKGDEYHWTLRAVESVVPDNGNGVVGDVIKSGSTGVNGKSSEAAVGVRQDGQDDLSSVSVVSPLASYELVWEESESLPLDTSHLPWLEDVTINSHFYVPVAFPPKPLEQPAKQHTLHLRKPGRKLSNWPVDPVIAVYEVENQEINPEPACLAIGGKRPKSAAAPADHQGGPRPQVQPPVAAPHLRNFSSFPPAFRPATPSIRTVPSPAPPPGPATSPPPSRQKDKSKKPKKKPSNKFVLIRVPPPKVDSRDLSESASLASEISLSQSLRPVSRLPL
ncbi:hypothetical protein GE09DRAFT_1221655 [Coniochaeta sp. 2T2.1]|nr:hypothetical protein GE09DRAFT_1221655 [Coniochaeta sp. 2T2.1]